MSTRSVTRVMDNGTELVCIYRQCDGYPSGMGADLKRILKGYRIVNGISGNDGNCAKCKEPRYMHRGRQAKTGEQSHRFVPCRVANGMGCMAASLVKALKDGVGNIYLYAAGVKDAGQRYEYTLWVEGNADNNYAHNCGPLMLKVSIPEFNDADEKVSEKVLWSGALDKYTPRDNNEL